MAEALRDENRVTTTLLESSTNSGVTMNAKGNEATGALLVEISGGTPFNGFANPTAQIGLTAVNGSADTAMRSDAAPALNQAITPTWTGAHIWSGAQGEIMRIEPTVITFGRSSANGPGIEWAGNNSSWEFQGVQGNQGATVISTGNATTPTWGPVLVNGQYTPVVTPGTNIASASENSNFTYIEVGNLVMIAGSIDATASGAGAATITFSLPLVTNNFPNTHGLNGSGAATDGTVTTPIYLRATSGAQTATIDWIAPNTDANTIRFTAMFTII